MSNRKTAIIGVCGGIAAYKTASLCSMLSKAGFDTHVLMTENATEFITQTTFETLTSNKCIVDTFDRDFNFEVEHIALAKKADVFLIAPATANIIAKIAHGIADNMLTTTFLASTCTKIVAPSMNTQMYNNPITENNIDILKKYGIEVITPSTGLLACKDIGIGKMPEPEVLYSYIEKAVTDKDFVNKNILVTAGPTKEKIDPVRYISNHSTGKMGYAIAKAAANRGANVTLVSGTKALPEIPFVKTIYIDTAEDMFNEVTGNSDNYDIIIKAAAVADYRPADVSFHKIKKSDNNLEIKLERTCDILKYLGENKADGQLLCGFSMETENLTENSKKKLNSKNLDMIVANNLLEKGAGFAHDTNKVTIITKDKELQLELMSKSDVANAILDELTGM